MRRLHGTLVSGTSPCDLRATCSGATPSNGRWRSEYVPPADARSGDGAARHPYHHAKHIRGEGERFVTASLGTAEMARKTRTRKDRTSLVISLVFHGLLIAGVVYWAHKSGQLEKIRQVLLQYAGEKKKQKKEEPANSAKTAAKTAADQPGPAAAEQWRLAPRGRSGRAERHGRELLPGHAQASARAINCRFRRRAKTSPRKNSSTASAGHSSACLRSSARKHGQAVVGRSRESGRVDRGRGG